MQGEGTQISADYQQLDAPTQHTQSADSTQPDQSLENPQQTREARLKRLLVLAVTLLAWSRFPLLRWHFVREAAWPLFREIRIRRPVAACIQFVRSRRWLTSAFTVCTSILAVVIYIEQGPATDNGLPFDESTVVFDDVLSHDGNLDLDGLTRLTESPLQTVLQAAGLQQRMDVSEPGPNQPVLVAGNVGNESPTSPAVDAAPIRGAWLTGVIETIPEESTVSQVAGVNETTQSRH